MAKGAVQSTGLAIRWRLTAWITAAFIVTIVVIFLALRLALGQILYRDVGADLSAEFNSAQAAIVFGNLNLSQFPFPVVVRDPNGNVTASNELADPRVMALSDNDIVSIVGEHRSADADLTIKGENFRVRSGRVSYRGQASIVQVGRSTQAIDDVLRTLT